MRRQGPLQKHSQPNKNTFFNGNNEWIVGEKVVEARDARYAERLRGALADLRTTFGDEAVLLLPVFLPHRNAILNALETLPQPEEITSNPTDTAGTEEE